MCIRKACGSGLGKKKSLATVEDREIELREFSCGSTEPRVKWEVDEVIIFHGPTMNVLAREALKLYPHAYLSYVPYRTVAEEKENMFMDILRAIVRARKDKYIAVLGHDARHIIERFVGQRPTEVEEEDDTTERVYENGRTRLFLAEGPEALDEENIYGVIMIYNGNDAETRGHLNSIQKRCPKAKIAVVSLTGAFPVPGHNVCTGNAPDVLFRNAINKIQLPTKVFVIGSRSYKTREDALRSIVREITLVNPYNASPTHTLYLVPETNQAYQSLTDIPTPSQITINYIY